jgi:hypothetical protein
VLPKDSDEIMPRFLIGISTAITLLFGLAGIPTEASAATQPKIVHTASLDWCPGNASICQDSSRLAQLSTGTNVTMQCWIDARSVPGIQYPRWFYVTAGSLQGFVKAEYVWPQTSTPNCSTNQRVTASLWTTGLGNYHAVYPSQTQMDTTLHLYKVSYATWGPYRDWSGDCIAFAALAWNQAGKKLQDYGNAYQVYSWYRTHSPKPTNVGTPPRGALVFWNAYSGGIDYGHVAVSLGNGKVVGTQGWDNQRLETTDYGISSSGYLGWVEPY